MRKKSRPGGRLVGVTHCGLLPSPSTLVNPGKGVQLMRSVVLSMAYGVFWTESQQMFMRPLMTGPKEALKTQPTMGLIFVNTLTQREPLALLVPRLTRARYQLVFTPRVGMKMLVRSGMGS